MNKPSKKAKAWLKQNSWFGKEQHATAIALDIHKKILDSGIEADTNEYYKELNKRLKPYAQTIMAEQLGILR